MNKVTPGHITHSRAKTVHIKNARGRKVSSQRWLQRHLNDPYVHEAHKLGYRSRAAYKILEIQEKFKIFKSGQHVVDLGSAPGGWSQVILPLIQPVQPAVNNTSKDISDPVRPDINKIVGMLDGIQQTVTKETETQVKQKTREDIDDKENIDIKTCANEINDKTPNTDKATPGDEQDQQLSQPHMIAVDLLAMEPIRGVTFIQGDFLSDDVQQNLNRILGHQRVDVVMSDMAANTIGHQATDHLRTRILVESAFDFAQRFLKPGGVFISKVFEGGTHNDLLVCLKKHFTVIRHFKPGASRKASPEIYVICLNFQP